MTNLQVPCSEPLASSSVALAKDGPLLSARCLAIRIPTIRDKGWLSVLPYKMQHHHDQTYYTKECTEDISENIIIVKIFVNINCYNDY